MPQLDRTALYAVANREIVVFHQARLARLEAVSLNDVLKKKNPYLFRAKNLLTASDLVKSILDAFLSSSEEELFGKFLEKLAEFICETTQGGRKSSAEGLDLEFDRDMKRYLVAVKSGPNWGNSSQWKRLEENFRRAVIVQRQANRNLDVRPVLGICYGKKRFKEKGNYEIYTGQRFWHFLSNDRDLYVDIIEPIGYEAKTRNDDFGERRAALENHFTMELIKQFCKPDYSIDWEKLVQFNSGNLS